MALDRTKIDKSQRTKIKFISDARNDKCTYLLSNSSTPPVPPNGQYSPVEEPDGSILRLVIDSLDSHKRKSLEEIAGTPLDVENILQSIKDGELFYFYSGSPSKEKDERKNLISNSIKKDNYDGENQYKVIGFGIDKITEKPKSKKLEKSPKKEEAKKKEVVISAGKKGSWTKELDDPKPNTIYKVTCKHGSDTIVYTYETDHLKRTVRVKGKLKLSPLTAKTREKTHRSGHKQQKYGPKVAKHEGKTEQYDGGHLIATLFMGPAEKINMIPQLRVKNQSRKKDGQWYKMEESWADFIRDGESVEVDIKIAYEKSANTPKTIRGSYTVSNDDPISFRCKN